MAPDAAPDATVVPMVLPMDLESPVDVRVQDVHRSRVGEATGEIMVEDVINSEIVKRKFDTDIEVPIKKSKDEYVIPSHIVPKEEPSTAHIEEELLLMEAELAVEAKNLPAEAVEFFDEEVEETGGAGAFHEMHTMDATIDKFIQPEVREKEPHVNPYDTPGRKHTRSGKYQKTNFGPREYTGEVEDFDLRIKIRDFFTGGSP